MKSNRKLIAFAVFFVSLLSAVPLLAQGPPQGNGYSPIDGGAFALLAGVVAYGYSKLRNDQKDKEN